MSDFEPSPDFVGRTMRKVLGFDEARGRRAAEGNLVVNRGWFLGLAGSAVVLGLFNLGNFFFRLLIPVNCL